MSNVVASRMPPMKHRARVTGAIPKVGELTQLRPLGSVPQSTRGLQDCTQMGSGNDARVPQKILRKCCSSLWALTLRTCSFAPSCIRGRWDHRFGDGTVSMA